MRHVVRVIAFFPAGPHAPETFEAWEHAVVVQADSLREALKGAVSVSRSLFDDPKYFEMLGYPVKPSLYAVVSIHSHDDLPKSPSSPHEHPLMISFSTFDERQVNELKAFEKVPVPVCALYIEQ
jgi:hypothetical protein